jgi:hypothetical protein
MNSRGNPALDPQARAPSPTEEAIPRLRSFREYWRSRHS